MIEQVLKKPARTFRHGQVEAVDRIEGKVLVAVGKGTVWIKTPLTLKVGDSVIVARNDDSSRFVVQFASKALPSQGLLLLVT